MSLVTEFCKWELYNMNNSEIGSSTEKHMKVQIWVSHYIVNNWIFFLNCRALHFESDRIFNFCLGLKKGKNNMITTWFPVSGNNYFFVLALPQICVYIYIYYHCNCLLKYDRPLKIEGLIDENINWLNESTLVPSFK